MKHPKKTKQLLDRLASVECPDTTYISESFPIVLKNGQGMNLRDVEGKRYLDFTACFAVAALGHRPPVILQAIRKQSAKLIHGMGDVHPSEAKIKLQELLAKITPFECPKSLLGLSGGDAVEAGLKTAILATNRYRFLSFSGAYHGLQTAPLSLNNRKLFVNGFENWIKDRSGFLPFPYFLSDITCGFEEDHKEILYKNHNLEEPSLVLSKLEDHLKTKQFAALVMEPIQGRGGKRGFSSEFVKSCKELCQKYGSLLIFDEIYTGFGRTGPLFALEHYGVIPDLLCLGKAMGGGFPISACVGNIMDVWGKSTGEARHTQTYLGHPLSCAVAYKNILTIQKKLYQFQEESKSIDQSFFRFIEKYKQAGLHKKFPFELRGKAFMRGLCFYKNGSQFAVPLIEKLLDKNILILAEGIIADVLSFTPPLIAKAKDYDIVLNAVFSILNESI